MEKIKKKILVIGSSGMMGHVLVDFLSKNSDFEIFNLAKKIKVNSDTIICDILETKNLEKLIYNISPDIIINAAGILVNQSKLNPLNAILINSCFPHKLVKIANNINSKIIHLSTDCVFDGSIGNYDENSKKTPIDIYGKTKDIGEIVSNKHLTIRTSIIGPELKKDGSGLFNWLLSNKEGSVYGYDKSIWSGLTTLELSKVILYLIENDFKGLIHISKPPITKNNLLSLINNQFNLNLTIKKVDGEISNKSLVSNRRDFKFLIKKYPDMINELAYYYKSNNYSN